ncbi:uncharacterized protein BYT42DRAFT_585046 [Radiomyces spectabilis]|uniref:uncharacterized protein n=1 Tax=Radiomyces spectabilis TaxID=64574 RepID=UPI00221FCE32|nr:uncharacterized protein BYT42DRAFT_585046 [Radiomyces spectabilis]KAI8369600.1 hypothetical protein BYT42DRAFT_585046 [Radiomyces spectabilis]
MLFLGSPCAANLLGLPTAENEGLLVTVSIDEYNTSKISLPLGRDDEDATTDGKWQVCSRCGQKTLEQLRLADGGVMHSVQHCTNCDTLWQRDANASRNIHLIAAALADGQERPVVYNRSSST